MSNHPCPFTPAVLAVIEPIIARLGLPVHDPFAGEGTRLGQLCDKLGLPFTGTEDIPEFIEDERVKAGDSTDPFTYPISLGPHPYVVVTSPVYPNGMTDHFNAQDNSRRHTYRQCLAKILGHDRELSENNMGRWGNRYRRSPASEAKHFDIAKRCVRHWPDTAIVNVKDVVATTYTVKVVERWEQLMIDHGYRLSKRIDVFTPGQRHGANRDLRADSEAVLVFKR